MGFNPTIYTLWFDNRDPIAVLSALRQHVSTPYWINILRFETPSRKHFSKMRVRVHGTLQRTFKRELQVWHEHPRPTVALLDYTAHRADEKTITQPLEEIPR